jgi:hypothetical protein
LQESSEPLESVSALQLVAPDEQRAYSKGLVIRKESREVKQG